MRRLFEGGLFWKLDTRKNCINYGNTIFRMKLTELASWFWFYRDRDAHVNFLVPIAVLIRGRRKIREGAYSSKYGNSHVTACYRMLPQWVKPVKICRWTQKARKCGNPGALGNPWKHYSFFMKSENRRSELGKCDSDRDTTGGELFKSKSQELVWSSALILIYCIKKFSSLC